MNSLTIEVVRGTRCVLVVIHSGGKTREYEYEQDSDIIMSARDGLHKWQNGDDDFKIERKSDGTQERKDGLQEQARPQAASEEG